MDPYQQLIKIIAIWLVLLMSTAYGRDQTRQVYVIPQAEKSPDIDGKLDESIWKNALIIDEFYQYTPRNGAAPTEKTGAD